MPRSVWYAVPLGRIRSSPVTTCVCVPTTALTRPSRCSPSAFFSDVSSQWKSTSRIGGSGSGARLVEQRVRVGERVLDRLHVGPALQVDHRDVRTRRGRRTCPSPGRARRSCRSCAAAAPGRSSRGTGRSPLVPDVVARRDHVDTRGEQGVGGRRRESHAAGHVLAVGGDEVDPPLLAQPGQRSARSRARPGLPIRSPIIRTRQAPAGPRRVAVRPGSRGAFAPTGAEGSMAGV